MELITIIFYTIIFAVSFLYGIFTYKYNYWSRRKVAYIQPRIPFGNIEGFKRTQHSGLLFKKYYDQMKNQHKFFGLYFFINPSVMICDLDLVKTVLIRDFQYFHDRGMYFNEKDDPLSAHLFNLEGHKWRLLRNKLSPTFTSGKMKFMFPTIVEIGNKFQQTVSTLCANNCEMEFRDILARFTTDVIGTCAFGLECNSLKEPNNEFRRMGKLVFEKPKNSLVTLLFMINFRNLARKLHLTAIREDCSKFFLKVTKETIDYRQTQKIKRNDFMDLLIGLGKDGKLSNDSDDHNDLLTFEQIAAQAFVFFLAGFETSSTAMSFSLYELAVNQDIQDKARAEIESVLKKHNGELTYEALMEMVYIEQIINESLRKYPPGVNLIRQASEDYQIPDTETIIEKGTSIFIPVYAIHHDPEIYPDPEKFDPDRFLPENIQSRNSIAWLPFGDGPRNCIGLRFGMLQSRVGLVSLLRHLKFEVGPKTQIPLKFEAKSPILTAEGGMWLNVKPI